MFIRRKKVKDSDYAYLVRNKWTKRGVRQKVSKYLGKIYSPEKVNFITYYDHINNDEEFINKSSAHEIICSLLGWVLTEHGFTAKQNVWSTDDVIVDLNKAKVRIRNTKAVLHVNSDYMCDTTLRRLLRYKSAKDQEVVGLELAKAFISAGVPVPEEVFVDVFQKVYKKGQSFVK